MSTATSRSLHAYSTLCRLKTEADQQPSSKTEETYLKARSTMLDGLTSSQVRLHYQIVSSTPYRNLSRIYAEDRNESRKQQMGVENFSQWLEFLDWSIGVAEREMVDAFSLSISEDVRETIYDECVALRLPDYHLPVAIDPERKILFETLRPRLYGKLYASCSGGFVHRTIVKHRGDAVVGMEVDHVNRNTFDCRSVNLRVCSKSENNRNKGFQRNNPSTGYKGVARYAKGKKPFRAQIALNGKTKCIGFFLTPEEAAIAYDIFARRFHGAYARVNLPDATLEQIKNVMGQIMASKTDRGRTSRYYGVSWYKAKQKWRSDVRHQGKYYYLGNHDSEEGAARAVDALLLQIGCREKLNFGKTEEDVIKI